MPMTRYKPEQIVTLLRQVEVEIANGKTTPQACRDAQITAARNILAAKPQSRATTGAAPAGLTLDGDESGGPRSLVQASETLRGCTASTSVYREKSLSLNVRIRLTPCTRIAATRRAS
jgi:hypothetical protein